MGIRRPIREWPSNVCRRFSKATAYPAAMWPSPTTTHWPIASPPRCASCVRISLPLPRDRWFCSKACLAWTRVSRWTWSPSKTDWVVGGWAVRPSGVREPAVLFSFSEPETCCCPPPAAALLAAAASSDGSRPYSATHRELCRGGGRGRRQIGRAGLGQLAGGLVHPPAGPCARLGRGEGILHGRNGRDVFRPQADTARHQGA